MAGSQSTIQLTDDGRLGRRVFSKRQAKSARGTGRMPWRAFNEPTKNEISTDWLDDASVPVVAKDALTQVVQRNASGFYGWLVVSVAVARSENRRVKSTPTCTNPYHVDIELPGCPVGVEEMRDRSEKHAQALAENADWRASP